MLKFLFLHLVPRYNVKDYEQRSNMDLTHRWKAVICMALTGILCLSGCSASQATPTVLKLDKETDAAWNNWGLTPDFSYEVKVSTPGIIVDQQGYATNGGKTAILEGKRIPDTFSIIDRDSTEVVYTGTIQKKENQNAYALFSDFTTPGTYRLQCMYLGQSYDFTIQDDLYTSLLEEALHEMADCRTDKQGILLSDAQKSVQESCCFLAKLLQTYELYGESILACEDGGQFLTLLGSEVQWLLTMQDASGAVYAGEDENEAVEDTEETLRRTAFYSAVMAKFGYAYRNEDNTFATICLKASDRAWKYVIGNKLDSEAEELFFAATELYRATGVAAYQKYIKKFAENGLPDADHMDDITFWGAVTYLCTRKGADKTICTSLMKTISTMGEQIALDARDGTYLTASEEPEKILDDMEIIAVMNHIITNHEYATVLENHLHYLLGRNTENQDLRQEIYHTPREMAGYIQLLAAVIATQ